MVDFQKLEIWNPNNEVSEIFLKFFWFKIRVLVDQFLNYLNMKPYTSILGVFCSLGYHI